MSRTAIIDELVMGAEPRVDLLPPEVKIGRKAKVLRRRLGVGFLGVLVLVGVGTATATWDAMMSQADLIAAQTRTSELLAQQTKFAQVNQVQSAVDTTAAAREFGASTEVDWKGYLAGVRALLPPDVAIDTVNVDSTSPWVAFAQPTAPLQAPRVATLQLGLTSPNLPTVPEWLDAMKRLPGFADATPGSISLTNGGTYTVALVIHIDGGAYSNRFASTGGK